MKWTSFAVAGCIVASLTACTAQTTRTHFPATRPPPASMAILSGSTAPFGAAVMAGTTLYISGAIDTDPKTGKLGADAEESAKFALDARLPVVQTASVPAEVPGGCNTPAGERTSEVGCYLDATELLGELPQVPLYWHLYNYPTRAAAEAAKGPRGTVVESFGRVWLYAIAEAGWHPSSGDRVAVIGPLRTVAGKRYTARYMEAVFKPGMQARTHRHSGPEAWYLVSGSQCLETPEGTTIAHAGDSAVVREGPPMTLSSVGAETRRSVLLVLHDTSQPWMIFTSEWTPKSLCPK